MKFESFLKPQSQGIYKLIKFYEMFLKNLCMLQKFCKLQRIPETLIGINSKKICKILWNFM